MGKRFVIIEANENKTYDEIIDDKLNVSLTDFEEICEYLNEQDEKIKELKRRLKSKEEFISELGCDNIKLKQSQNSKAIEVLERLKKFFIQNADEIGEEYREDYFSLTLGNIKRIIDNQITELRGGV